MRSNTYQEEVEEMTWEGMEPGAIWTFDDNKKNPRTKQEEVRAIFVEDFILQGFTHENAPPDKDCLSDCDVLKDRDGKYLGEHGNSHHNKCMDCWEGYVDRLTMRLSDKGVVIKVDEKRILEYDNYNDLTGELDNRFEQARVEPLVKE